MKKLIKRLMLVVALILSVAALFAAGGYTLVRGTPDYYKPMRLMMTEAERAVAAASAERTLARIQNFAADSHGASIRDRAMSTTRASRSATTAPADAERFTFTEPQLNALFEKWSGVQSWREKYEQYVTDPVLILRKGTIILAGQVKRGDFDTVLSLHFEPAIDPDAGAMTVQLTRILAGRLPVPQETILSPVRTRAIVAARTYLPQWQRRAAIESTGWVNEPAVNAALTKDALKILGQRPIDPVLFIPVDGSSRRVPVRITDMQIGDGSIALTVIPLTGAERTALLDRIREPLEVQTAMNRQPTAVSRQ
jgi:hypothetical protein